MIKNILRSMSVFAFMLSIGMTVPVSAQTCTIQGTGTNSDNSCTIEERETNTVTCNNDATVVNDNDQDATTGDANVDGNTNGGNATTGDASNSNDTSTTVDFTCDAIAPANTTNPGGGGGAGAGSTQGTSQGSGAGRGAGVSSGAVLSASNTDTSKVAALPNTGINTSLNALTMSASLAGGLSAFSMIGAALYRRS